MSGIWSLDNGDLGAKLENYVQGEMSVALATRRDEIKELKGKVLELTKQRDEAIRITAEADRTFEEVRTIFLEYSSLQIINFTSTNEKLIILCIIFMSID